MSEGTMLAMAEAIERALQRDGISQAEFCRRAGVSTKHLNQVLRGKAAATTTTLDYWASLLGRRFDVLLL